MRLRLLGLATMLGGALAFGGASSSTASTTPQQDDAGCVLPGTIDEELAAQFETELRSLVVENADGTVDADATLDELLGLAGKYDLPEGQLIVDAVMADLTGLPCPTPGGGSKLEGDCLGMVMSFDKKGHLIDIAADLDPDGAPIDMIESRAKGEAVRAFSKSNPFQVDVDGFVAYVGKAGEPGDGPKDHHWSITTFGIEMDSGGDPNVEGKNRNAGGISLKDDLPAAAKINALFKVEGQLDSVNGISCVGAGYFETTGGLPLADGVGVLALVGAGLGALFNARPARTWKG